jgi:hypothetical protein
MNNEQTGKKPRYVVEYARNMRALGDWLNEMASQGYAFLDAGDDPEGTRVIMELVEQPASDPIAEGSDNSSELLNACRIALEWFDNPAPEMNYKEVADIVRIAIHNEEARREALKYADV